MHKTLIRFTTVVMTAAAGLAFSAGAMAQPRHDGPPPMVRHAPPQKKHKVWVPAHREHGHVVKGHYVWR